MNEEVYSVDRYKGHLISVVKDNNIYYGEAYENGVCAFTNVKSNSPEGCLEKCKRKIDMEEITYASYYNE